jgi:peptidoglycan/xylan/chitin deacetylase (PgdA/CDA1 family)
MVPSDKVISVPILTYHQITPEPHAAFAKYGVTPDQLAAQLRWIADNGYVPVRLSDVFGDERIDLPRKPIVLTFDDGFVDCVDFAVPLLQEHHFPAVFFLCAGLLGQATKWLVAERGLEYPLIGASTARTLLEEGFECGAHGVNHVRLAALSPIECLHELRDARAMLEDSLGCDIRHMSYPFGSFSPAVRDMAESCGYWSASTVQHGVATTADDPFTLKRLHVIATESPLAFTRDLTNQCQPANKAVRRIWQTFVGRS